MSPHCQPPCKIVAFVPATKCADAFNSDMKTAHVVLQTCVTKGKAHSTLYEEWNLTDEMETKPVSALVRPCLTILLDETKVCVAKQHAAWATEFN